MNDELLLIDKPAGWTSFDVVAKLRGGIRRRYQEQGVKPTKRQLRVGHAGTLDPFATGLLIILFGDDCKRAGEFLKLDKVYEATIRLGFTSSTGDPEGELTPANNVQPSQTEIEAVLATFVGEIQQTPPVYSAIKIDGTRAYKLARDGKAVEMPERTVTIHSLELVEYAYPDIRIRAHVGSGTYIRSLSQDIGEALGTGAYTSQLRRTRIAHYSIAEAHTPDQIDEIE
ncbi:MAG TPA: tRNA pseudouridine(55) synthase TruB [Candidatus Saccharimonadales bacterium]